ncbi:hypothetical protein Tco_1500065 [Tanacetum coccineum]
MVKPVWNNTQRVNHQNFAKKTHPCAKKNLVPRAVLMKSGLVSINTARQNISKTAVSVNTARQVNTAHSKTTVNAARPMSYLSKTAHSTVKRPIHKNTTFKNSNIDQRVNTISGKKFNTARPKAVVNVVKGNNVNVVKASACWVWKPKTKVLDHGNPQMDLQDQGVSHVFFLATKDETSGILKSFITGIENLVDHKVKVIRCDNDTEFSKQRNEIDFVISPMEKIEEEEYGIQPPGIEIQTFLIEYIRLKKHCMDYIKLLELGMKPCQHICWTIGFKEGKLTRPYSSKGTKQKKDGIFIIQDKYVVEILKKFRLIEVKTTSTPMETQKPLLKDEDGKEVDVHMYRSMIGSLMYLTSSRPDIMFTVCACARYQVNPKVSYLHAVKRIFKYLKSQPKLGLWYLKDSLFDLVAYTDSDYAGASLDRKSTTGGCQFLRCRLISWQCKKQTVVANSITEAEYEAALSCCGQVLWIQNQLLDYGYNFMHTKIFIDNNRKAKKSVKLMMEKLFGMELELMLNNFWSTGVVKTINGEVQLHALVDGKKVIITEVTVRRDLQLEDEEGVDCLPNSTIFEQLTLMSSKTTAWNEFSSTMASAIICLATNQKFKFSKYIFESMVRNLDNLSRKFLMYPRIYIASCHTKKIFGNMKRVGKGFSGRVTPLFPTMVVQNQSELGAGSAMPTDPHHIPTIIESSTQPQKTQKPRKPKKKDTQVPQPSGPTNIVADEAVHKELGDSLVAVPGAKKPWGVGQWFKNVSKFSNDPLPARGNTLQSGKDSLKLKELMELCINLQQRVLDLEKTKTTQQNEIASLKRRVKKLE